MKQKIKNYLNNLFSKIRHPSQFSKLHLAVFMVVFGLIGYFIVHTFAASPLVARLEAEQMSRPAGSFVISDSTASGGKAIKMKANGAITGSVNFPSSVTSVTIIARGRQCNGAPSMTMSLDSIKLLTDTAISATDWTAYTYTPVASIAPGTHKLSISFNNAYSYAGYGNNARGACQRKLFVDVTNFYGPVPLPTPAPTVALSASPSSVATGQSSTLTWTSTNATSCTASGAWSGAEPTSGSVSTGAVNQNSTYTLDCTGTGGTVTTVTTVTVTSPIISSIQLGVATSGVNSSSSGPGSYLDSYASMVGGMPKEAMWYQTWVSTYSHKLIFPTVMNDCLSRNVMPMITWMPYTSSDNSTYAAYTDISAGKYDSYINEAAAEAKAWGHPFYLRPFHEMNGHWVKWGIGVNGNTSDQFIAAWQHIVTLFHNDGATNALFVFSPNIISSTSPDFTSMYPGNSYVDWVGLDGYNWGTSKAYQTWRSFTQIFQQSYNTLLTDTGSTKPIMIAETASTEVGGDKAAWINNAYLTEIPQNFSKIKLVNWFNFNKETDWRVNSSSTSLSAYQQVVASSMYK